MPKIEDDKELAVLIAEKEIIVKKARELNLIIANHQNTEDSIADATFAANKVAGLYAELKYLNADIDRLKPKPLSEPLQITADDLKLHYGKGAKFSSSYAIHDVVSFQFCNYLPAVTAVILMAVFDGTKVLYTIGVPRNQPLKKDIHYKDGMLLDEFEPDYARTGYLSTGYSKFDENENCELTFNLFYNVVSDRIFDFVESEEVGNA